MIFLLHSQFHLFYYESVQVRRVDPSLDMEADQGDDYTHLPVG